MVRPKLSQALKDEFEVRRQLGVTVSCAKAKGYQGARRARQELERRQRYRRQSGKGWDDLTFEIQGVILSHLTILDIYNLRLSGLGGVSIASRLHLQTVMRKRIEALRPVYYETRVFLMHERTGVKPTEFALRTAVKIGACEPDMLVAVGRDMIQLTELEVAAFDENRLTDLPKELARCQRLSMLTLQFHDLEAIPDVVLQLGNLRNLCLNGNSRLKEIPEDIGERLPLLRTVGLLRTKVSKLPDSLLMTLEKNFPKRGRNRTALLVNRDMFADGYLERTICPEKYPKLAENVRRDIIDNLLAD